VVALSSWEAGAGILLAFGVSAIVTSALCTRLAGRLRIIDHPNDRSLHEAPVPRTGGLGVLTGLTVAGLYLAGIGALRGPLCDASAWLAAAAALVGVVSFLDDRAGVSAGLRLLAHLGAAGLLIAGGFIWAVVDLPWLHWRLGLSLALPLTLLGIVWMINLYNFMDGMDGFAGGMAVFGFGALAALGWQAGDPAFAAVAASIAAAAGGFLISNFPPARIFLGDTGSSTLGLLAAGLSLLGAQREIFPLWVAGLAFSPFIVDATWTLIRRLISGERLWEPHRSHHYQRLVLAGWGHRKTLLWSYVLMAASAATAFAAVRMPATEQAVLLAGWVGIYLLVHVKVGQVERAAARGGG
jgi:UDP-N-acetylmuramyl pentapeptide phosphotransferase/UDP-N-acetylglucosamine-1-phosphate transferase